MQTNRFKLTNIRIFEKATTGTDGRVRTNHWMRVDLVDPANWFNRLPKWVTDENVIKLYLSASTQNTTPDVQGYTSAGIKVYDMQDFDKLKQEATKIGMPEEAVLFMQNVYPVTVPTDGLYARAYKRDYTDKGGVLHKKGEQVLRNGKPQIISALMLYVMYVPGPDGKLVPFENIDEITKRVLDENYVRVQASVGTVPAEEESVVQAGGNAGGSAADTIAAANAALAS